MKIRASSIRSRILAIAMLPVVVLAIALGSIMILQRQGDLESNLMQRGHLLARQLAAASDYGVFSGNVEALQNLVDSVASEYAVMDVAIIDREGRSLAAHGHPIPLSAAEIRQLGNREKFTELSSRQVWRFSEPIRSPSIVVDDVNDPAQGSSRPASSALGGVAVVTLSTTDIFIEKRNFALIVIGILTVVLVVTAWLARRMSGRVSKPIVEVSRAVERIGKSETGIRVKPSQIGVLNLLGNGVNQMAERLERSMHDLEQRVTEATQQLIEKKDEAERANSAKSRFLAAASHDLRQPMHALGMFVAALAQPRPEAERQQLIEQISTAVGAMGDLLDSLLDISRLDAGGIEARLSDFPLQNVFDHLRSSFAETAEAKGLDLVVRRTTVWVRSDRILMERILTNFASNAIRYTNSGRILIAARPRSGHVLIEVRDSGVGIPPEEQQGVFQEFVQLNNPERDRSKGIGLGLAIVKRLAELLNHRLILRSRPGAGSTFAIEAARALPVVEPVVPSAGAIEAAGQLNLRVLVIDDDPLVRNSLDSLLKGWGCAVHVEQGDHGLPQRLHNWTEWPDLILCDFRLANGLNGIQLIQAIQQAVGQDIAAVIITGDTDAETLRVAGQFGHTVLQKPVRPAQLRALLRTQRRALVTMLP